MCNIVQAEIPVKDASLKTYKRIYAPEAPAPSNPPETALGMRHVKNVVQSLLSDKTALILETGDSWFQGQKMKLPHGCGYEFQVRGL